MPNPPTEPDVDLELTLAEPPSWPKTVGTISIIWAGLGLTCTGCGLASMAYKTFGPPPAEGPFGPPPAVLQPSFPQMIATIPGFIWLFLLLAAGITTVGR